MASSQKGAPPGPKKGQATILGFFKKVEPSTQKGAATGAQPPSTAQASTSTAKQASANAVKKPAAYAKEGPLPSPPSSVSGGSVSPIAFSSKPSVVGGAGRQRIGSSNASSPGPFAKPRPRVTAVGSHADLDNDAGQAAIGREQPPTPPASSPPPMDRMQIDGNEDEDEEEELPQMTRRRSAAKKRKTYYESGSDVDNDEGSDYEQSAKRSNAAVRDDEDDEDDDFEADVASDASASPLPEPRRSKASSSQPASRPAQPPTTKKPRQSLSGFGAGPSRPPIARASTSATSAGSRASPSEKPSNESSSFSFLVDRRDMDGNRPGDADFDPRTLSIPNSWWGKMTNFEKQYFEIKQYNMDTILMFQKGKFYEMFLEDARIAHQKLDLKLTDRGRMPMVGVPESSFDLFATKLLALGFKVGRVDQMETAVAKGMRAKSSSGDIVRRELRHVMTSGTMIEGLEDDQANYCITLVEDIQRVDGQEDVISFGICALDAATSDFSIAHWVDDLQRNQLETLLTSMRVKEVIHKKGNVSKETTRLIRNCVAADCRITMLRDGKEWLSPEATQAELIDLYGDQENVPEAITSVRDSETAMSALAGMFAYLAQLSLLKDLASSRNFSLLEHRKAASGAPMHLDANTLGHLCVLANEDGSDTGTLHRLLNRCVTPAGKRLFTRWLTHPLSEIDPIRARQDAVEDLLGNIDFEDAFSKLKKMPDFERLIPKVSSGKIKPCDFIRLLTSFKKLSPLVGDLDRLSEPFGSHLIKSLLSSIPDVAKLAAGLDEMFVAEEDGSFQPRENVDEAFDEAQALVEDVEAQLEGELRKCRKHLDLGSQKNGGCNWKHRGTNEIYQIEVPKKTRVPNDWAIISQTNTTAGYYPPVVRSLVQSLKEARETRVAALKSFQAGLFAKFNEESPAYLTAVRALAELDCLQSLALASYAMGEPTCRPTLVECDTALVDFRDLRHPCIANTTDFIANDVKMGGEAAEVIVLTGGNMAGKSTTARTTATGVILAQMGCRVPARSATLSPADRICSRMGANDQIFRNSSTFMVEMLEASRIVKDCTPRSLVIMDELGRGTSTFDGHAIAHAVLHHLVARTRCLCFFLTHYLQLAYDFQDYPRCSNKHMAVVVDDENREVVFTYRLVEGVAESSYGTQVAHLAGVPAQICDRASDISKEFAEATKQYQAQRTTSALPMATLSDFAYLMQLGKATETTSTHQVASQLQVVRAQIQRIAQGAQRSEPDEAMDGPTEYASSEPPVPASSTYAKRSASYAMGSRRNKRGRLHSTRAQRTAATPDDSDDDGCVADAENLSPPSSSTTPMAENKTMSRAKTAPASPVARRSPLTPSTRAPAEQLVLDLGQKLQVTCRECGMSYDRSCPNDAALHLKHHDRVTKGVEWSGKSVWACGELLDRFALDRAVLSKALGKNTVSAALNKAAATSASTGLDADSILFGLEASPAELSSKGAAAAVTVQILRYALSDTGSGSVDGAIRGPSKVRPAVVERKLLEVLETVDASLSASALDADALQSCTLLLAVACNRVLACAVITTAIPAGTARRVLRRDVLERLDEAGDQQPDGSDPGNNTKACDAGADEMEARANDAVFASSTPLPPDELPRVGVHRIYVLPSLRRHGLARKLLDAALEHAVYGMSAAKLLASTKGGTKSDAVAFSQPTDAGRSLARAWLQNEDLIVFQE